MTCFGIDKGLAELMLHTEHAERLITPMLDIFLDQHGRFNHVFLLETFFQDRHARCLLVAVLEPSLQSGMNCRPKIERVWRVHWDDIFVVAIIVLDSARLEGANHAISNGSFFCIHNRFSVAYSAQLWAPCGVGYRIGNSLYNRESRRFFNCS